MSNLHDDALTGNLTEDKLDDYLLNDPSLLNKPGGARNLTPLAAACSGGHLKVIRLLADRPANPDAPSRNNRTPLFYATQKKIPNQLEIVRTLLNADADVDKADDNGTTPLMNAIVQLRDKNLVHLLVEHNASVTAKNKRGKTPEILAKECGMEQDLRPRSERNTGWGNYIDLLVALVVFILKTVNSGVLNDVVSGVVSKLFGVSVPPSVPPTSSTPDVTLASQPEEALSPQKLSVDALVHSLDEYIADTGLDQFFKPGDPFLQNLAKKAAGLTESPYDDPENVKRLTTLSLYQPVIYCDDSGSMAVNNRIVDQRELVKRIARITTRLVPDDYGVELSFINAGSRSNLSAAELDQVMETIKPGGGTKIGTNLRSNILCPLVYKHLDSATPLRRPVLVCTITDGCPAGEQEETFKDAIVECREKVVSAGYASTAVMFSISQIGSDDKAARFLDKLNNDQEIQDVLYCTTDRLDDSFKEMRLKEDRLEEWLLKTLTAPITADRE
ncbi:hypothetical protein BJ138DRAFT_1014962 [Hygrophoropsis aurantiaca]|uniref:Uncharacterized protein n=1 Tax=Hygrophoropsis aurantiaca TaxID=72124 RepID=A0ACB8A2D4_9AGAM|nr:hypothetical protein BJ138DRAFT_1014962 [Hygrophoropsis aurantiaca]